MALQLPKEAERAVDAGGMAIVVGGEWVWSASLAREIERRARRRGRIRRPSPGTSAAWAAERLAAGGQA